MSKFYVHKVNQHWSTAIATEDIAEGDLIGKTVGVFCPEVSRWTIQVARDLHIDFHDGLEYINHSCDPNTRVVVSDKNPVIAFFAIKDIAKGEELFFDYATSEWDMDEKFTCQCGTAKCRGYIGGAKYLTPEQLKEYESLFTPPIRELINEQLNNN